jgi:membrane protein implicated in regulation of membrane protease activity
MNKRLLAVTALATLAVFAFAALGRFEARLSGVASRGTGKAKFEAKQKRGEYQAELEFEGEHLRPNSMYEVHIEGSTWMVSTNGFGSFAGEFRYGSASAHPPIDTGTPVTVTDINGNTVLAGSFALR